MEEGASKKDSMIICPIGGQRLPEIELARRSGAEFSKFLFRRCDFSDHCLLRRGFLSLLFGFGEKVVNSVAPLGLSFSIFRFLLSSLHFLRFRISRVAHWRPPSLGRR